MASHVIYDCDRCSVGWPRCRNKAATVAPIGNLPLCNKHARDMAQRTLGQNAELVWALRYLGWITDPNDPEQRDG